MAIGISAGGMSAGQLVMIPLASVLTLWFGWRTSYFWLGVGLLVLVLRSRCSSSATTPRAGSAPLRRDGHAGRRGAAGRGGKVASASGSRTRCTSRSSGS